METNNYDADPYKDVTVEQEKEWAQKFNSSLGAVLRSLASYENKSIKQLSRDTGIEYVTLGRYLRGERDIPMTVFYRCVLNLNTDVIAVMQEVAVREGWVKLEVIEENKPRKRKH